MHNHKMMYILYKVVCDLSTRNQKDMLGEATAPQYKSGRCSKVSGQQVSRLSLSDGSRLNENDKDFSLRSK